MERSEWRLNGTNLAAAAIAQCMVVVHTYSFGLFLEPMQKEFGWSYTFLTSGMTLQSIIVVIGAPFLGMLIDRIGPRPIGVTGLFLFFAAFGGLALTTPSIALYYGLWVLIAFANLSVKTTVWVTEIVRCFERHRGMAIAIVISGTSVGAILIPVVARYFIDQHGWRSGFLWLAATGFIIAFPLVFLFFGKRGKAGLAGRASSDGARVPVTGQVFSRQFLQLAAAAMLFSVCVVGITTHMVPIAGQYGLDRAEGAKLAALIGVGSLVGRLITGTLLDRWEARAIGGVVIAMGVVGALLMLFLPSPSFIWVAVLLLGLSLGAELDIIAYLAARIFGAQHFATLFGIIVGLMTLCVGVGPLGAAFVLDTTGSYRLWFWISAGALTAAALMIVTLRVEPQPVRSLRQP